MSKCAGCGRLSIYQNKTSKRCEVCHMQWLEAKVERLEAEVAEERRLKWLFLRFFASDRSCSHEEALDFAKRNLKDGE